MFCNIFYDLRKSMIHIWTKVKGHNDYDCEKFVPYVFVEDEEGTVKSIDGKLMSKKTFDSYGEYYVFVKEHPEVHENIVKPEIQFLAERYYNIPDDEIENPKLKIFSIDIEVLSSHIDKNKRIKIRKKK